MAKRENVAVVTLRVIVPIDKGSSRSQIAVSTAILAAEEGHGLGALAELPGVEVAKVEHRHTTRVAGQPVPPTPGEVEAASVGQAGEVTVETVEPSPADPQETGPASVGEEQADAVEEAATGGSSRRRRA